MVDQVPKDGGDEEIDDGFATPEDRRKAQVSVRLIWYRAQRELQAQTIKLLITRLEAINEAIKNYEKELSDLNDGQLLLVKEGEE